MSEPLTSSGATLRSRFVRLSKSGWGGLAFWSILIGVTLCLLISGYGAFVGANKQNLHFAFLGGMSGFAATAIGALAAIALRDIAARTQDIMLGFAAGMMLAASSFSLILPGIEAAQALYGNQLLAACVVVAGLGLGVALMIGLDRFVPHEHEKSGRRGPEAQRINRVWLFVLAITLHNLPEGMAIGVSFANGDMKVGLPLTTAIAIQDIPEGLAVALALRVTGISALRAALIAVGSGLMEPIGAIVGLGVSSSFALGYPIALGLAAGAMIFVVSHEVIPETHRNGHETPATLGLMLGFGVMMFLDTALG
ncbi:MULTISPECIES: ZIP family metal transporter [Pseudomonas]|uniref:Putative Zinc transporter ZIP protein n=1 Tax=Pseudomonas fluorescens (strain Pf0-1) TaxID=205922 RepID=Q3KCH7_PSEPF|nr:MULTISPECIES: ZIP family metal transporter [Pseudomonas]ABA74528.1 putative Zinc transporter ZIP protein [Pseudomonas fluorescens Pf0-1]MBY9026150.1 ZIP family metal transporter [Pseudomonas fluorescens]MBY9031044.1 ZIP family metal transporter [Pseudomonas fluorescens]MBY9037968.1 ZIP family metal transporter [Pseudomonas fluorescens]MBY9041561.1 ZIP family metal transporter [Pseudomonas fluorescens]